MTTVLSGLTTLCFVGCNDATLTSSPVEPTPEPPDSVYSDVYYTRAERKVDVLWVVDDSGSMGGEQDKLATDFAEFIADFVDLGLDYHLAVVTTDVERDTRRGRIQGGVLTPDTPDILQAFSNAALVGTAGSKNSEEQGLEAARLALTPEALSTFNAGFLRDDAVLAIIVVSDEDDQSTPSDTAGIKCVGTNQDTSACAPVADYISFFQSLKSRPELVQLNAIVGDVPDGCSTQWADADASPRYHEAVSLAGGQSESICNETFGPALANLGNIVSKLARSQYPVTFEPIEETIEVRVDGTVVESGPDTWHWDAGAAAVVFDMTLAADTCTEVAVTYEYANTDVLPTAPEDTVDATCPAIEAEPTPEATPPMGGELNGGAIAACSVSPQQATQSHLLLVGLLLLITVITLRRYASQR